MTVVVSAAESSDQECGLSTRRVDGRSGVAIVISALCLLLRAGGLRAVRANDEPSGSGGESTGPTPGSTDSEPTAPGQGPRIHLPDLDVGLEIPRLQRRGFAHMQYE